MNSTKPVINAPQTKYLRNREILGEDEMMPIEQSVLFPNLQNYFCRVIWHVAEWYLCASIHVKYTCLWKHPGLECSTFVMLWVWLTSSFFVAVSWLFRKLQSVWFIRKICLAHSLKCNRVYLSYFIIIGKINIKCILLAISYLFIQRIQAFPCLWDILSLAINIKNFKELIIFTELQTIMIIAQIFVSQ